MEHQEIILYKEPTPETSREEVSGGLGICLGFIIENARLRTRELKSEDGGTQEGVKRSIKSLINLAEILVSGIKPGAEPEDLASFVDHLKIYTDVMYGSMPIAKDKAMLADMVDRFGLGLQTSMSTRGLLSEEAKKTLKEINTAD